MEHGAAARHRAPEVPGGEHSGAWNCKAEVDDGRSRDQNRSGARSALDISLHLLAGSFLHQLSYSPKGFTILHRSIDSGAEVTSVARYEDFEAVGRKEHESCRKHCLAVREALLGRARSIA